MWPVQCCGFCVTLETVLLYLALNTTLTQDEPGKQPAWLTSPLFTYITHIRAAIYAGVPSLLEGSGCTRLDRISSDHRTRQKRQTHIREGNQELTGSDSSCADIPQLMNTDHKDRISCYAFDGRAGLRGSDSGTPMGYSEPCYVRFWVQTGSLYSGPGLGTLEGGGLWAEVETQREKEASACRKRPVSHHSLFLSFYR